MSNDNWKHRSEGMRCKTCIWFAPKESLNGITHIGRCRRHAPTMNGYPVVFVNDWCGDHKLNENNFIEPTESSKLITTIKVDTNEIVEEVIKKLSEDSKKIGI